MGQKIVYVAFALVAALGLFTASQPLSAQDQPREEKTGNCNRFYPFGAGATQFSVCLSNEGNVVQMFAWGFNQMHGAEEGYQLCTVGADYRDFGPAPGGLFGWGAAVVVDPSPADVVDLSITRTTTDGQWRLKQTFTKSNNKRELGITMSLKKLSSPIGGPVYLERWDGMNRDGSFGFDIADQTTDSVTGRQARGVALIATTFAIPHTTAVGAANDPFFGTTPGLCTQASAASPTAAGDPAGYVTYSLPGFNTGETRTVKFAYRVY